MVSGTSIVQGGSGYARYLAIGQHLASLWEGYAAKMLGIDGKEFSPEIAELLSQGKDPFTADPLKPIHKQKISLWDLTVSAPKSVSLLSLYDDNIRLAHQQAASLVPRIEQGFVPSGNLVYSQIQHYTSRAGDPQLHSHTPIMNLTWNQDRGEWECLRQNFMHYRAQRDMSESYRMELGHSVSRLGYSLIDREKGGFEIEGISRELVLKFSQRNEQISKQTRGDYAFKTFLDRPPKLLYAQTYDAHLHQQKEKLTPSEKHSLQETVDIARERSYRLSIRIAEGEDGGEGHKHHTYGQRMSM